MQRITNEAELNAAIEGVDVSVLKVGAPWCGPCKVIETSIKEIEGENADSAQFLEVNIEEADEDFVDSLGIRNIPVIFYYKDGKLIDKTIGLVTKAALLEKIKELKGE